MNLNAFIYLLLTLLKFSYSKSSDQCSKSNTLWNSLKYPYIDVLKLPSTQFPSLTCPKSSPQNCCVNTMNKEMTSVSELKLKAFADEKYEKILMMLSNDSYDLMHIYLNDLENTKNDLNQLFSTTYGYNYKVHKEFFFTWFEKLKLYMQGRLHNIGQLLDNFFLEMAQRIVRILIAPDSTPDITACRTTRLIEAKPYQDTDVLLKKKIIRSYPPARLLVNGIGVGRDVFNELIKNTAPSAKCVEQFNTAFHCMLCQGLQLKTCSQSCGVVIENCFGSFKSTDLKKLDRAFTKYIRVIVQLAGKLDNPFNFPEVNNKMNVQISTAIMNVQTMYPNVKDQINAKCQGGSQGGGGLPISRKRRQASQEFYDWQTENNKNSQSKQQSWWEQKLTKNVNEESGEKKVFNDYQNKPNDVLSPFARKIKLKFKALEGFFKNRRTEFCDLMIPTEVSADCWNGTAVIKNSVPTTVKETKKKNEKIEDTTIKLAVTQLVEITKKINLYLTDKNPDPDTMPVKEYKIYASKKANKINDNMPDNSPNQKIDGSGDLEGNKFPDVKPGKVKEDPVAPPPPPAPVPPAQPNKWNEEFQQPFSGSGDTENKLPDEKTKKTAQLPIKINPVTVSTSTRSTLSTSKAVVMVQSTRPSTVAPNNIPDDEDLNPPLPPDNQPKINPSAISTPTAVIQTEGSGIPPVLPDINERKPLVPQPITTTTTLTPFIDGSGEETKPDSPKQKPKPILPMLPDQSKPITDPPIQKPDPNPDEDKSSIPEGSGGRTPDVPYEPPKPHQPIVTSTTPSHVIIDSTKTSPVETLSPDQYPGKVPPEVWLPGIKGVNNEDNVNNQRTTPSGSSSSLYRINIICRTMLIILSLYSLL